MSHSLPTSVPRLQGASLVAAGMALAAANFIVILDMTIANVSVPHIAGGLAVSGNEGTYVITSYAVAEAVSVPLTGWLASRFGTVRVFVTGVLLFGLFSMLCGFASSLEWLIFARILQGLAGGPLMPLSQTLLMSIFPKEKQMAAMGIWSMTTLVAPILGPIVGGYICDTWGWPWIFFINIPLTLICVLIAWILLNPFETKITKVKMDKVGLILLITFVAALQLMLDEGQKLDWFESPEIIFLSIVAGVGFVAFLIWELTQQNPIVDLKVFRHRGFSVSVVAISLGFGAFFGSIVLLPLWLQTNMEYTATWSGLVTAANGILAVVMAPFVAKLAGKIDVRKLASFGILWLGLFTFIRSFNTSDMTYANLFFPLMLQGMAMPFFFIPLSSLGLSSVDPQEMASAAGLMNFLRTLSGAFATSLAITAWSNQSTVNRTEIVSAMNPHPELSLGILDRVVESQSVLLATNNIFRTVSLIFIIAALSVWLAHKPDHKVEAVGGH